jgi:hypothetical protein
MEIREDALDGLPLHADLWPVLAATAQPSLRLVRTEQCDPTAPQTRLGGHPLLPPGTEWPRSTTGEPLSLARAVHVVTEARKVSCEARARVTHAPVAAEPERLHEPHVPVVARRLRSQTRSALVVASSGAPITSGATSDPIVRPRWSVPRR